MNYKENSLVKNFQKIAWNTYIPVNATLELSVACNLKCLHCYNFDRSEALDPKVKASELSENEVYKVIDELKTLGSLYIAFTGGEPLMHPLIFNYIHYAKKQGFIVRIKTNGLMLTQDMCKRLKEAGVYSFDISVYGLDESTYQNFTRVNNACEKVYAGIANAIGAQMEVTGNIVVHKKNYKDLRRIIQKVQALGAKYAYSDEITERYTQDTESPKTIELDDDDYKFIFNSDLKEYFMVENEKFAPQCACARTNIGISSQGDVFPCIGAPIKAGNIRENNLKEIWKESDVLNSIRGLKEKDFKDCESCTVKLFCQRSSGAVYANTNNYTGCDPSTLRLAKLRSKNS